MPTHPPFLINPRQSHGRHRAPRRPPRCVPSTAACPTTPSPRWSRCPRSPPTSDWARAGQGRVPPARAARVQDARRLVGGAPGPGRRRAAARLVTATDGNHGRAVARMAALLGLPPPSWCRRASPEGGRADPRRGCAVEELDASYDDAVRRRPLAEVDPDALLVQDTSWPGTRTCRVDRRRLRDAVRRGRRADGRARPGLRPHRRAGRRRVAGPRRCPLPAVAARLPGVTVEPEVADCLAASLAAGEPTTSPPARPVWPG